MPMRFRKTVRLGKGVNLNFNKNSVGVSIGGKAGRLSVNSKGRKTTTVHTPIKGVSFVDTKSSSTKNRPISKGLKTSPGMLVLTILLGWTGIQRYASGQIGIGFLYTMTLGLCGIGWFYDIVFEFVSILFS